MESYDTSVSEKKSIHSLLEGIVNFFHVTVKNIYLISKFTKTLFFICVSLSVNKLLPPGFLLTNICLNKIY